MRAASSFSPFQSIVARYRSSSADATSDAKGEDLNQGTDWPMTFPEGQYRHTKMSDQADLPMAQPTRWVPGQIICV
jgi:hypothetical protein